MTKRLIQVYMGKATAGAVVEKTPEGWKVVYIAPYLRKVVGQTRVEDWGGLFTAKGFTWSWIGEGVERQEERR